MTRKQIDASREIRLWIIQVIMPATALVMAIPETRNAMIDGFQNAKRSVKNMFQKPYRLSPRALSFLSSRKIHLLL